MIFESLPGVETILVSIEPSRPGAWKKKRILEVIERLRRKGRPLVLKTKNDSEMFLPDGLTRDYVLQEIKAVIEWKEKMNDGSSLLDRP